MKLLRSIKLLKRSTIIDILFYLHLTFGFLIASIIAVTFQIDHVKTATIWSIIFVYLIIQKTKMEVTL